MSLPVVLISEAQAEFDEAFDYYEGKRPGLGVDFVDKVQAVFDRLATTPRLHRVVFQDVRKAVLQKFPFCVFYREEPSQVVVVAVFPRKRDPAIWQDRAGP